MDACTLHKLHNAGHKDIPSVADSVDLHFLAEDVFVDQHGFVRVNLHGRLKVVAQHLLIGDDLHRATAKDKARPYKYGIPDLGCGSHAVLDTCNGKAGGLRDIKFEQNLFKAVTVFRSLDGCAVGSDKFHPAFHQRLGKIDGCLPAQGGDDTLGFLEVDDSHHILRRQRLKVELVAGGIVGRNRFRVVVDDNSLISVALDGLYGMNSGIVKFHTLSDADRPCAENDNLFLLHQP